MSLDYVILGLLEEPASGYDLKKLFEGGVRHFWSANFGQIYPALKRMEKDGWLTSKNVKPARAASRKVYSRTKLGSQKLKQWLEEGPAMGTDRLAYFGQLRFLGFFKDPEMSLEFVDELAEKFSKMEEELASIYEPLRKSSRSNLSFDELHSLFAIEMAFESIRVKKECCLKFARQLKRVIGKSK